MLTTSLKIDCLRKIEDEITVPVEKYFVKNESSIWLCYYYHKSIEYIPLRTPKEVALFLMKHGVIKFYCEKGDEVKMYASTLHTITGSKGEPVQFERNVLMRWSDIEISRLQVLHYAAIDVFEKIGGIIGFAKSKVFGRGGNRAA